MCKELATLFPTSAVFWNGTVHTLCIRYVKSQLTGMQRSLKQLQLNHFVKWRTTSRPQYEATFVKWIICGLCCEWLSALLNIWIRILKVLYREMDRAEVRFIRKVFIKERSAEIFRKIRPSPILWDPFKDSAHHVQPLAIPNAGMKFIAPLSAEQSLHFKFNKLVNLPPPPPLQLA